MNFRKVQDPFWANSVVIPRRLFFIMLKVELGQFIKGVITQNEQVVSSFILDFADLIINRQFRDGFSHFKQT